MEIYRKRQGGGGRHKLSKTRQSPNGFRAIDPKKKKKKLMKMYSTKSFVPKSALTTRSRTYKTHDNGGRPYKLIANSKGIRILSWVPGENVDEDEYEDYKMITKFKGYWSGFDSEFCCKYEAHGNSILIQLSKTQYMFVGHCIYTFESNEEILDYVTPLGNNDVPYPVAYSKSRVYFMLDRVYINKIELEFEATVFNAENLYGEFYGWLGTKKGTHPKRKMTKVKMISKRFH